MIRRTTHAAVELTSTPHNAAGVQYTDGSSATDHGGFSNDDVNVGLLIAVPGATSRTVTQNVTSTQVRAFQGGG